MRVVIKLAPILAILMYSSFFACSPSDSQEVSYKIDLRILYAGHPGSDREKDFVEFLSRYFIEIKTGNFLRFKEKDAEDFDVIILDYDEDVHYKKLPKISKQYNRSTVTIREVGAGICDSLRLKTGYL